MGLFLPLDCIHFEKRKKKTNGQTDKQPAVFIELKAIDSHLFIYSRHTQGFRTFGCLREQKMTIILGQLNRTNKEFGLFYNYSSSSSTKGL